MESIPDELRAAVHAARHVTVLTGAGVSAESGLPTFRDALTGSWAKFDPQELATPAAFQRNPERVSRWYDERRCHCAAARPNAAHAALAAWQTWQERRGARFVVLTQNVDRLHQLAGSRNVIELHGSLWVWRCLDCNAENEEHGPAFPIHPPRCACGGVRRPGVVWFGENLPLAALTAAQEAVEACDLFVSVGTSALVEPAASFLGEALTRGTRTLEVNLEPTPISSVVDWSLRGRAGAILPALVASVAG